MKNIFLILLIILCPIFVNAKSISAVEYIENIATRNNADKASIEEIGNTGLAYDGTVDNNLRYIGANPNNYVDIGDVYKADIYGDFFYPFFDSKEECMLFHKKDINDDFYGCTKLYNKGEPILWRIIGVMNNISDSNENKNSLIKLVRDDIIGYYAFYDSEDYHNNPSFYVSYSDNYKGYNVNDYAKSNMMIILNDYYYNSTKGIIDYNDWLEKWPYDFTSFGFQDNTRKIIQMVKWNIGGVNDNINGWDISASNMDLYSMERGDETFNGFSSTWIGRIGTIYGSDLGMSVGGERRLECLKIMPSNYRDFNCDELTWLKTTQDTWTITSLSSDSDGVVAYGYGDVYDQTAHISYAVQPAFYLKSNTIISSGNGTKDNPYKLMLEEFNSTKLTISSKKNIKDIFESIDSSKINWKVEDESILRVDNGTIIPLKVGVTEILGELDGVQYRLSVEVTEDLLVNPKTTTPIFIILGILSIVGIVIIISKKGQKQNHQ